MPDLKISKTGCKKNEQELIDKNKALKDVQRFARIGSWTEEMFHIYGIELQADPPSYGDTKKLIHPDDWESFDSAVSKCLSDGTDYKLELRAKGLVQQILTYAQKKPESRIVLKSSHNISEAVKFLCSTIPATIDIKFNNKAEPETVLADPTQLNQIVERSRCAAEKY